MDRNRQIAKLTKHLELRLKYNKYYYATITHGSRCLTSRTLLQLQTYIYIINKYPCKKVAVNQDIIRGRFDTHKRSFCTMRIRLTKTKYLEYGDFSTVTYGKHDRIYRYTHNTTTLMRILSVNWTEIYRHAKQYNANSMKNYLTRIQTVI